MRPMFETEIRLKHARVAEYLDAHGLDAVLLSRRCNFSWYTCGARNFVGHAADAGNSWLLVDRDGAVALTNNIESPRLGREELAPRGIDVTDWEWHDAAAQRDAMSALTSGRAVAADAGVAGLELERLGTDFDRLRYALLPSEIERYRGVCTDVISAVESAGRQVRAGMTEHEVAGLLSAQIRRRGLLEWVVLVAADRRLRRGKPLGDQRSDHAREDISAACRRHTAVARRIDVSCFHLVDWLEANILHGGAAKRPHQTGPAPRGGGGSQPVAIPRSTWQ